MSKELIVKSKTEIATQEDKTDILSLYGVPAMLDQIVKKEKKALLNELSCSAVVLDSLNKLAHSENFVLEIPEGLRELLKSGKAAFDNSSKSRGSFTPNIRIKGESGIKGQATIAYKTDSQAVTQSLSNLAMMAMVQSVLEKLNVIEEKVEDVIKGQKDDRIGSIIGHFKGFMDLYPTFKTPEELNNAATMAYMHMQSGLTKLHLQIEEERKKLNDAPADGWQAFWKSITNPFHNESIRYKKIYEDYVYDIQLYNRLILLSDVILHLKGDIEAIARNHKIMVDYCSIYIDDSFKKKMSYLMNNNTTGITNILEYNKKLDLALEGVLVNDIKIQCKKEDIKFLNFNEYGSQERR